MFNFECAVRYEPRAYIYFPLVFLSAFFRVKRNHYIKKANTCYKALDPRAQARENKTVFYGLVYKIGCTQQ
jgi:hypothetical protein